MGQHDRSIDGDASQKRLMYFKLVRLTNRYDTYDLYVLRYSITI